MVDQRASNAVIRDPSSLAITVWRRNFTIALFLLWLAFLVWMAWRG